MRPRSARSQLMSVARDLAEIGLSVGYDSLTDVEATKFIKTEQFRYQDAHLEIDLAEKFAVIDSRRLGHAKNTN